MFATACVCMQAKKQNQDQVPVHSAVSPQPGFTCNHTLMPTHACSLTHADKHTHTHTHTHTYGGLIHKHRLSPAAISYTAMHTKKSGIEEGQEEQWMRQARDGVKDGWMGGVGRPVTGVCTAGEICNEISVSQTGCYTLIPLDNRQTARNALECISLAG